MNQIADYRIPLNEAAGHVYVSTNSLRWNPATAGQGNTVNLGPGRIASGQGHTIALRAPDADDPAATAVIGLHPPVLVTVADVERELARPSRSDPPMFLAVVGDLGWPVPQWPPARVIDGEATAAWTAGQMEVSGR